GQQQPTLTSHQPMVRPGRIVPRVTPRPAAGHYAPANYPGRPGNQKSGRWNMRHRSRLFVSFALLGIAGLVAVGCGSSAKKAASSGTSACPSGITIGFFGALTGNNSPQLGINEANGVQLAIEQFNSAHPNCHVSYKAFDSQGDPAQAPALATTAIN